MSEDPTNEDYWWNNDIPDNWYKTSYATDSTLKTNNTRITEIKRGIPFRIEYPLDKSVACRILMGHTLVLRLIEKLLGTPSFIPTWDSLVFKHPGSGVPIKWHRDASATSVDHIPAIDVGFYLDSATPQQQNCLWVIPGTHKLPDFVAAMMVESLIKDGFQTTNAIPIPVNPGDIIFHNILVLHGSSFCSGPLRRTVYFEFRAISQELKMGPHKPEYIPLKQNLLRACLEERSKTNYDQLQENHQQYKYVPEKQHEFIHQELSTFRYPHKIYFRDDYKG